ncbi:MAG: FGGY-family carbohydrate kinase [Roseobacter sp.]
MRSGHIAIIDIGKTNVKLALVDLADLSEIAVVTRPNVVRPGPPYPHFDVEGHWTFLLAHLAQFHASHGVRAIAVTTHGAAAALLKKNGALAAPILDYEHTGPEGCAETYDAMRPPFCETGSPRLAMGLNIGAQVLYQFETVPGLREATKTIVTYPQYWGHRLTGIAATDVTSLGAHTDLWNPFERRFSSLTERLGIFDKMAKPRPSNDVLGPILPDIAERTGLPADTPVFCGIHDSNASLLPHLLGRKAPFSVVSTGTWVIAMAIGGAPIPLDPTRDTLINVNAFGDPVPSARFMGGREHDLATGKAYVTPTDADVLSVLQSGVMLLPAVVPEIGPFMGRRSSWVGSEPAAGSVERSVCAGFYLALVTAQCLELIGHRGVVVVEGPFAQNRPYLLMLAVATGSQIDARDSATGTSQGAALLAMKDHHTALAKPDRDALPFEDTHLLDQYARRWTDHVKVT